MQREGKVQTSPASEVLEQPEGELIKGRGKWGAWDDFRLPTTLMLQLSFADGSHLVTIGFCAATRGHFKKAAKGSSSCCSTSLGGERPLVLGLVRGAFQGQ